MTCEEITPHLNKFAKVSLKNNKRQIGWLFYGLPKEVPTGMFSEVLCMKNHFGTRIIDSDNPTDVNVLKLRARTIAIEDILEIRSIK